MSDQQVSSAVVDAVKRIHTDWLRRHNHLRPRTFWGAAAIGAFAVFVTAASYERFGIGGTIALCLAEAVAVFFAALFVEGSSLSKLDKETREKIAKVATDSGADRWALLAALCSTGGVFGDRFLRLVNPSAVRFRNACQMMSITNKKFGYLWFEWSNVFGALGDFFLAIPEAERERRFGELDEGDKDPFCSSMLLLSILYLTCADRGYAVQHGYRTFEDQRTVFALVAVSYAKVASLGSPLYKGIAEQIIRGAKRYLEGVPESKMKEFADRRPNAQVMLRCPLTVGDLLATARTLVGHEALLYQLTHPPVPVPMPGRAETA